MASTSVHDLKTLVLSFHPVVAIDTVEEARVVGLMDTLASELGLPLYEWSVNDGLIQRGGGGFANRSTAEPLALLRHLATLRVEAIYLLKDFAVHLADATARRAFRDVAAAFSQTHSTLVICGASHDFPPDADAHVVHYPLALPDRRELSQVVNTVVDSLRQRMSVQVELSEEAIENLLRSLSGMTSNQARQAVARAVLEDGMLSDADVASVLSRKAELLAEGGLLEYFPPEDNAHELGGFARLTEWLARARMGFSKQAAELNLAPPRGILLVGVQGCGKSLAARCIARSWKLPLLKLDAGSLYDKYVGESEKNLRRAIQMAESMAPAVLWIDEIEKGLASTGGGDDSGVSQRMLATFLTWMQEKDQDVFLVATANDVFRLPPELMRKGRFDEIFFVDLPNEAERRQILEIHLGRRKQQAADFDLPALVEASDGFSGAELEQAVIAGLYRALHESRSLDTETLLAELQATVPLSVSRREDLVRLRELARRFVPVS